MANNFLGPYFSRVFNSKIESKNRATAISIIGSLFTISILAYELISANIIEHSGYQNYFVITGALLLIFAVPMSIYLAKKLKQ